MFADRKRDAWLTRWKGNSEFEHLLPAKSVVFNETRELLSEKT